MSQKCKATSVYVSFLSLLALGDSFCRVQPAHSFSWGFNSCAKLKRAQKRSGLKLPHSVWLLRQVSHCLWLWCGVPQATPAPFLPGCWSRGVWCVAVGQAWDTAQLTQPQLRSVWGRAVAFVLTCYLGLLHSRGAGARRNSSAVGSVVCSAFPCLPLP